MGQKNIKYLEQKHKEFEDQLVCPDLRCAERIDEVYCSVSLNYVREKEVLVLSCNPYAVRK